MQNDDQDQKKLMFNACLYVFERDTKIRQILTNVVSLFRFITQVTQTIKIFRNSELVSVLETEIWYVLP